MEDQTKQTTDLPFVSNKVKASPAGSAAGTIVMWLITSQLSKIGIDAPPEVLAAAQLLLVVAGGWVTGFAAGYFTPQQPVPLSADKTKTEQIEL